jgi:hypothetical protein
MRKLEKWVLTTLIVNTLNNTIENVEYGRMRPESDTDATDSGDINTIKIIWRRYK